MRNRNTYTTPPVSPHRLAHRSPESPLTVCGMCFAPAGVFNRPRLSLAATCRFHFLSFEFSLVFCLIIMNYLGHCAVTELRTSHLEVASYSVQHAARQSVLRSPMRYQRCSGGDDMMTNDGNMFNLPIPSESLQANAEFTAKQT